MAVCDFDMRFTFVVPGWPGSVHDTRVWSDAIVRYDNFPQPPTDKYYLVDSGYPNRVGYLAPYKGQRYHVPEFQQHPPRGRHETFNHRHSSLRNVVERSFGVLKMKWRILLGIPRIAVVTGGNKWIGLEVCRQLASDGVKVVLTARDDTRGAEAVEKLKALGLTDVIFHQLEITDASSIATLAEFLETRFGRLDILVNNAAVVGVEYVHGVDTSEEKFSGLDFDQRLEWVWTNVRESDDAAKKGVQTNYYGTKHVIEALLPLLQSSSEGRIVNVSSDFGLLRLISNEEVRQELDDIDSLTEERLDELLDKFLKDFEAGALEAQGWPIRFSAYKVAKAAMNSYTRILARRHPALHVNCAHPGYVKTDMTMNSGLLTAEEGARNVVKVALLPDGGPTGVYFAMGQEASFV